jgi:hypothetical protein
MTIVVVNNNDDSFPEVRDVVSEHDVRFEVWPELAFIDGRKAPIGYEIEISGQADCDSTDDVPGCERCDRTFSELRRIAVLAGAQPADIPSYDSSWHSAPKDGPRRRIVLTIRLTRFEGDENSADEIEHARLVAIEKRLTAFGVRRGRS